MDNELEQRDWLSRALGKHPSLTIAAIAIAGVVLVVALAKPSNHVLQIKCYFQDAQGVHPGAKVRLAGVDVGLVTSVRARPELRDHPAEVVMVLQTPYELKVPNDSVVSVEPAAVLGEAFAEIDVKQASGPPLETGGQLKTRPSENPTPQQWMECFSNLAVHKPCDLHIKGEAANQSTTPAPDHK